jgi:uncharacterized protein (UPF0332 family)
VKAKEIIINSLRRSEEERGLRVVKPNDYLSEAHIRKADHNLIVMTDLSRLGHEDWVVISAYYAMYQSAIALLARIGMESKDHATTVAVLEYFFGKEITRELIQKFNELKEMKEKIENIKINEKYIEHFWKVKQARETLQYGISITYRETDSVMRIARDFVSKIKLVLNELDEKLIEIIHKEIEKLQEIARK